MITSAYQSTRANCIVIKRYRAAMGTELSTAVNCKQGLLPHSHPRNLAQSLFGFRSTQRISAATAVRPSNRFTKTTSRCNSSMKPRRNTVRSMKSASRLAQEQLPQLANLPIRASPCQGLRPLLLLPRLHPLLRYRCLQAMCGFRPLQAG